MLALATLCAGSVPLRLYAAALCTATLGAGYGVAACPQAQPAAVSWLTDLPAALADATAKQRLVLACLLGDTEPANARALDFYASQDFAKAAAKVACVLCSKEQHGNGQGPCSRFKSLACTAHMSCELAARRHFFGAVDKYPTPQHILLFPDGVVAWHGVSEFTSAEFLQALASAERSKALPLAQRLRAQRVFLTQARGAAGKDTPAAYLQVLVRLVQTPAEHFLDALTVLDKTLAERLLADLEGFPRERALPLLRAAGKHAVPATRELALQLAAKVEQRVEPATADDKAKGANEPLAVLGPADDFRRVHWVGEEQTLQGCRDQIAVLWFFLPGASDIRDQVAEMNQFVAARAGTGVRVLGFAASKQPAEAKDQLTALGCSFPVGAYLETNANKLFAIAMFPAWIVLDPDTDVVYRSRQDGKEFRWEEGRELAVRMASSPAYAGRLSRAGPGR
jgi:hypothetical protein